MSVGIDIVAKAIRRHCRTGVDIVKSHASQPDQRQSKSGLRFKINSFYCGT
jgi:hypothetical protein